MVFQKQVVPYAYIVELVLIETVSFLNKFFTFILIDYFFHHRIGYIIGDGIIVILWARLNKVLYAYPFLEFGRFIGSFSQEVSFCKQVTIQSAHGSRVIC